MYRVLEAGGREGGGKLCVWGERRRGGRERDEGWMVKVVCLMSEEGSACRMGHSRGQTQGTLYEEGVRDDSASGG